MKRVAESLAARLKARIATEGPIGVDDYMRACLSDPEAGYYRAKQPIGAGGDFITAPEISQIFGELIFVWCASVWQGMGAPAPFHLVELGPGRGTLMADLLRAAKALPTFRDAAQVTLIEQSEALVEQQRAALAGSGAPILWQARIEDVPPGPAIVIANEFIDALPIRQFVMSGGAWRDRRVGLDADGHFAFMAGRDAAEVDEAPQDAEEGAIFEIRPEADALVAVLGAREAPVAALFIDYGHGASAAGDTLQAVRKHAFADVFDMPGEADLTAHVDFAALARAAQRDSLSVCGPLPQGDFLLGLGLAQRLSRLCATATPEQADALTAGAQRLTSAEGMGILFKAMALVSPGLPPPPPWDLS